MRAPVSFLVLLLVAFAEACQSGTPASTGHGRPSSSAPASSTPSVAPAVCPNPDGGACVGRLTPGRPYTTVRFLPPLTYSVPTSGWSNDEDLFGNFLLVPPGNTLEGVNAGTSDYIGVYRAVLPSLPHGRTCDPPRWPLGDQPGPTSVQVAHYFRTRHDLSVSPPRRATVGGLHGVVIDIATRPGTKLMACRDEVSGSTIRSDWLISGVAGSSLDHGVIKGMTMRLYLLDDQRLVLGIEIDDVHKAPTSLGAMTTVAESLRFQR